MARQRKLHSHPKVVDDIRRLDEKLAIIILEKIVDLGVGRVEGQPLQNLPGVGDLADCRKLYVGRTAVKPTHRIVYRHSDDGVVEIIEIVVVGERESLTVYLEAIHRLGR